MAKNERIHAISEKLEEMLTCNRSHMEELSKLIPFQSKNSNWYAINAGALSPFFIHGLQDALIIMGNHAKESDKDRLFAHMYADQLLTHVALYAKLIKWVRLKTNTGDVVITKASIGIVGTIACMLHASGNDQYEAKTMDVGEETILALLPLISEKGKEINVNNDEVVIKTAWNLYLEEYIPRTAGHSEKEEMVLSLIASATKGDVSDLKPAYLHLLKKCGGNKAEALQRLATIGIVKSSLTELFEELKTELEADAEATAKTETEKTTEQTVDNPKEEDKLVKS